jgi:PAS domain S-box-containing protein
MATKASKMRHRLLAAVGIAAAVLVVLGVWTERDLLAFGALALAAMAATALWATSRAAEEERQRLAALLDALPAGVALTDAKGGFTHVNAEFRRIWGAPPSPHSSDEYAAWRGFWPETGRPVEMAEWALVRALANGEVTVPGDVVEIEKFDGSGRATVLNAAAPIRNAAGAIVGGVLAEVDLTAQKRAEAAAREAERRMRSVVEHLPSGLVVADLSTGDLHWNAEALRIHGYGGDGDQHKFLESLLAEHDLRTLAGEAIPVSASPLPRLLAGEAFRDFEVLARNTRLGWERVFSYSGAIIPGPGGAPALGLLSIRDVTDRSRAEQAVREANAQLREADRRKDEFLGMLSHELRNPLAPIRNALFILDHAAPDGPQARRAREIANRQLAHLTRLVDDLLDVTRVARGKVELRRADLDVAALARRAADDHRALMQDRDLELDLHLPAEPVLVYGDETRLSQVLGNLLQNAAKFTPAGGRVALEVRALGGRAELRVRDTGAGIAPEVLPRIFEPFTQARQTLARSEGGLGLGLAMVRGLVALHGGEVRATSPGPGRGTEFVVTLPLAPQRAAGPQATAQQLR